MRECVLLSNGKFPLSDACNLPIVFNLRHLQLGSPRSWALNTGNMERVGVEQDTMLWDGKREDYWIL